MSEQVALEYLEDAVRQHLVWTGGLSGSLCLQLQHIVSAVTLLRSTPSGPAERLYEGNGVLAYAMGFTSVWLLSRRGHDPRVQIADVAYVAFVQIDIKQGEENKSDYTADTTHGIAEAFRAAQKHPQAAYAWPLSDTKLWLTKVDNQDELQLCLRGKSGAFATEFELFAEDRSIKR